MKTLFELLHHVWDLLDSGDTDGFHPHQRVTDALNNALQEGADALSNTPGVNRYTKSVGNLAEEEGFNEESLLWPLPSNFLRPLQVFRPSRHPQAQGGPAFGRPLHAATDPEELLHGPDRYFISSDGLQLSDGTDPENIRVYYVYQPTRMEDTGDRPDWIEGKESWLVFMACAERMLKGDAGDPRSFSRRASDMWPSVVRAARRAPFEAARIRRRATRWEKYL